MENKTKLLIAVGAAFVTQCQPCLKTVIMNSIDCGAAEKKLAEVIGVAKLVRKNAMTQIDKVAADLAEIEAGDCSATSCGCSQTSQKLGQRR